VAQKPIEFIILPILEPYLDRKDIEFWANGSKEPTLPTTSDMKVNVRELVRELMDEPGANGIVKQTHEQHFFNKEKLAAPVNALAVIQGISPIGSRVLSDGDDAIIRGQIAKIKQAAKAETETFAEIVAENAPLRAENAALKAEKQYMLETGQVFRTGEVTV
jgi:hypothetical protein